MNCDKWQIADKALCGAERLAAGQVHRHCQAHHHSEFRTRTIWQVFADERPSLVPYAGRFDGFHATPASVSKTCLIRFDHNRYSVMASAVGRPVEVRAYADTIEIRQDGQIVRPA